ncbi:regulatory protein RecX [Natronospira bacteriovora]|uniref:Regulatory protein RecX n=1 Tax=Natronospira bacteriovora TaxID=3069753 RepID=A0ABU0W9J9_9GAMM|nr:regulatory protein RecX [Natronospira sp. AB-CW4]MDQ2070438.1 regulatory protein RecX [Natronospira sp. AB-CW4]
MQTDQPEDSVSKATAYAVRLLSRREYARAELAQRLSRKGYGRDTTETALARLEELGYLCEERFVEHFVRSRVDRGSGPMKIRAELQQRGVDGSLIDHGLREAGCDFSHLAADVRRRKFGDERPATLEEKARQARFLAQRGFAADHVRTALDVDPAELGLE